ncbi:hypothetical protein BC833DRAFT_301844 [Globomyces pollinis-pini]|nr:hypothetical protein BC833DRAFT_301844 [Globomyces pollinis-pini]
MSNLTFVAIIVWFLFSIIYYVEITDKQSIKLSEIISLRQNAINNINQLQYSYNSSKLLNDLQLFKPRSPFYHFYQNVTGYLYGSISSYNSNNSIQNDSGTISDTSESDTMKFYLHTNKSSPNIFFTEGDMQLKLSNNTWNYYCSGFHFPANGSIVMQTSSRHWESGLSGLDLLPDPLDADVNGTIKFAPNVHTNCSFDIFIQLDHLLESREAIQVFENELDNDEGISTIRPPHLTASALILSKNCNLTFKGDMDVILMKINHQNYHWSLIFFQLASGLELVLIALQMQQCTSQSTRSKISALTISMIGFIDFYVCTMLLVIGLSFSNLFLQAATIVFFKLVMFALFEIRFIFSIIKSQHRNDPDLDSPLLQAKIYMIYVGGANVTLMMIYKYTFFINLGILVLSCFWIPQIVRNILRNTKTPFTWSFIVVQTVTRALLPLSIWCCPVHRISFSYSPIWPVMLLLITSAQLTILYIQQNYGPRAYIPHQLLPRMYDYHSIPQMEGIQNSDCAICFVSMDLNSMNSEDYMITPCMHIFHSSCLEQWMEVRFECPICRNGIPLP